MGACYSKQPLLGNSSKAKAPKIKCQSSKDNGTVTKSQEVAPDRGNEETSKLLRDDIDLLKRRNSEDVIIVSSSLFLKMEPSDQIVKAGERGVAPSDSGIESIGTIPDEGQENCPPSNKRIDLSKRLERLSRGSCHKCGNFKLDDSAITALLTNSYCLCGPRQAGRSIVNPQCQTHGARNGRKGQSVSSSDTSANTSDIRLETSRMDDNSKISVKSDSEVLAPLAHFDSIDFNLNNSPVLKSSNSKRRSLLSEILDLTDSVCKCDFYSNEYCCVTDGHGSSECRSHSRNKVLPNSPKIVSERHLTDISFESQTSDVTITRSDGEEDLIPLEATYASSSTASSPRKTASLTKNVSFAREDASEDGLEKACVYSPAKLTKKNVKEVDCRNTTSETSSGIYTHSGSLSETLLTRLKDSPKRTLSLGSQAALLSISSSEALDDRTEEDLASLDLDSLSRVTSLSYGSIRQLMESTEDLVQPLEDVKRVVVDGEDCVAMPVDTYYQLQSDLASLKQQLIFLSSLMQEVCDRREPDNQALSASFGI